MVRRGFGLDYAALLEETVSLMEERTLALTPASEEIGEEAAQRNGLGENAGESIARAIRRHYKAKHGPSRGRRAAGGVSVYPGLGVLYDTLEQHLSTINRTYGLPLSPRQRQDLDAVCEEIGSRLRARLDALDADARGDLEGQVRRDVINLDATINPGELIARERERIQGLLDDLDIILAVKNIP